MNRTGVASDRSDRRCSVGSRDRVYRIFFFFQAEDGIRDVAVTGVQTCALPIFGAAVAEGKPILVNDVRTDPRYHDAVPGSKAELVVPLRRKGRVIGALNLLSDKIGRASCRERV